MSIHLQERGKHCNYMVAIECSTQLLAVSLDDWQQEGTVIKSHDTFFGDKKKTF